MMKRLIQRVVTWRGRLRTAHWRWLTAGLAAVWLLLVWTTFTATSSLTGQLGWVDHTHVVLGEIAEVQSRVTDVETAQRGYLLTGDASYLQPFLGAPQALDAQLRLLRALTFDNPAQQANLDRLDTLMSERLVENATVLAAFRHGGFSEARAIIERGAGKRIHDQIRATTERMRALEERLLGAREADAGVRQNILLASMIAALIVIGAGILLSVSLGSACQRAETMLRDSEKRYRQLFDASPIAALLTDFATGAILMANDAAAATYCYSREMLTALRIDDLFDPLETARVAEARRQVKRGEAMLPGIWLQRRQDGSAFAAQLTAQSMLGPGPHHRLVIAMDVTEREAATAMLRESERRFQEVFEQQFQLMATLDLEGRIEIANASFAAVTRRDAASLIGTAVSDLLPDDESGNEAAKLVESALRNARETRRLVTFVVRYQLPRHGPQIMECALRPVLQDSGAVGYFILQARDVTAQVLASEAVATSERRLRAAQERAGMCSWEWNLASQTMSWSANAQRLLARSADELPSTLEELAALAEPDSAARVSDFLREMTQVIGAATIRFVGASTGSLSGRHFELVAECAQEGRGQPEQLVGILTDISESLFLQRRLHQAQRLEAVGKLTGGIAHDFNNLLTVIIGNNEVLVDELTHEPELSELAELSLAAASRGADLTLQLLAFARRQPLAPSVVNPAHLVRDMYRLLRKTVSPDVEVEFVTDAGGWNTLVDPAQLESAMLNLAINARDAMPDGGKLTIEVANSRLDATYAAAHPDVRPGAYVMIAVSDTGSGMPPEVAERVFEPFFTTKEGSDNSGLGLSMVHGFIKQTGGHINVYTEVDNGTTIRIYLPRHAGARTGATAELYQDQSLQRGSERLLVVEDDDLVRRHVASQLTGLGYSVVTAENAAQALEIFEKDRAFDLLFTDVVMPGGMNGRELADAVRAIDAQMPLLFTSGYTETAIVHHGRLDDGVYLLSKPYRLVTLSMKVRQALDEQQRC